MFYLALKLIHVLAVIIFLGNITVGLYLRKLAEKTNDPSKIAFTFDSIIKLDRVFTLPGVLFIIIGGFAAAIHIGYPIFGTGWIYYSLILFGISGLAFMIKIAPLQRKIYALASGDNFNWDEYHKLVKQWEFWGLVALITPYLAVVMMVMKHPA